MNYDDLLDDEHWEYWKEDAEEKCEECVFYGSDKALCERKGLKVWYVQPNCPGKLVFMNSHSFKAVDKTSDTLYKEEVK